VSRYAAECHCISSDVSASSQSTIYATRRLHEGAFFARRLRARPRIISRGKRKPKSKRMLLTLGSFGFLRSNSSSRPFLARARCNRTPRHFCQKCIVHSVCNLWPSPSPSPAHRIASHRIASHCIAVSRSEFYGSPRPSKNTCLRNNEIITFVRIFLTCTRNKN